ncbi:MAG: CCA tRNA nucleotidyltransferase [Alkalinema sp. RU_4_3]|nr:CCA tRNA nucleotidyltransferase [Alkalinema sp. RU_4_3]
MDSILRFALEDLPRSDLRSVEDQRTPTQWVMDLSAKNQALSQATATALAIAIHRATRSLTDPETTLADAEALTWLMGQDVDLGALQVALGEIDRVSPATVETQTLSWQRLIPEQRSLLTIAAEQASHQGWQLYLVGGGVRDLLLGDETTPLRLKDLDLVVAAGDRGAGLILAEALKAAYPEAQLTLHSKFQTAAMVWNNGELAGLAIDLATARTEFYLYPGANPVVTGSDIDRDLFRRDFTVNAMALCLTDGEPGRLIDRFGGRQDLAAKQLRILHPGSFLEDPTRIYRGARFAVRLGFEFDPDLREGLRSALKSGFYERVRDHGLPVPALQGRLRSELKYLFEGENWRRGLVFLDRLGALGCIHPHLTLSKSTVENLRRLDAWIQRFGPKPPTWQLQIETLLMGMGNSDRTEAAQNLQMPPESLARVETVGAIDRLPEVTLPSEWCRVLVGFDRSCLILAGVCLPNRRQVLRAYLTRWSLAKPWLDGGDLQGLGYRPGKGLKTILADLREKTIDGVLGDPAATLTYLQTQHPLKAPSTTGAAQIDGPR